MKEMAPGIRPVTFWTLALPETGLPPPAELVATMDAEERTRADEFRHPKDRATYLWAHALLRGLLAARYGKPAEWWQFRRRPGQRPEITSLPDGKPLSFSLTHTSGLVAAAVCEDSPVGIDAERRARPALVGEGDMATTVCTPDEQARLAQTKTQGEEWRRIFYNFWVRKEAVAKALGLGLGLPFGSLDVMLDTPRFLMPPLQNIPPLRIWQPEVGPDHVAAVAHQGGSASIEHLPITASALRTAIESGQHQFSH